MLHHSDGSFGISPVLSANFRHDNISDNPILNFSSLFFQLKPDGIFIFWIIYFFYVSSYFCCFWKVIFCECCFRHFYLFSFVFCLYRMQHGMDTPSRTGRKLQLIRTLHPLFRYTLPYREETLSVYAGFSPAKHLVMQIAQITFLHY